MIFLIDLLMWGVGLALDRLPAPDSRLRGRRKRSPSKRRASVPSHMNRPLRKPEARSPEPGARSRGQSRGSARATPRGFTLLEVMVAVGIVSMVGVLIYGAFMGMSRSRKNMEQVGDRYHQGRQALSRMSRELGSAFLSAHQPFQQLQFVRETTFIGADRSTADRVDFTAFAYMRLEKDTHESDQCEISYYAAQNPETGGLDLVRRVERHIDDDPSRGGLVQVLAEDIDSLEIRYLDPLTNTWLLSWDTTQPAAQLGRLPSAVWITLWLRGGPRGLPIKFETKAPVYIQLPLNFATGAN